MKNLIGIAIITVLFRYRLAAVQKSLLAKYLPDGCEKISYNPEDGAKNYQHFSLKNNISTEDDGFRALFKYENDKIVKKYRFRASSKLNQLSWYFKNQAPDFGFINMIEGKCYYRFAGKDDSFVADAVYVYIMEKRFKNDLYEFLSSKKAYKNEIQWQIDLMIKIALSIKKFQDRNMVHRNLSLESIKMTLTLKNSVSFPVIDNIEDAISTNDNSPYKYKPSFFLPENETRVSNEFSFDIYSLGKIFYHIANPSLILKGGSEILATCTEDNFIDTYLYCEYLEPLVFAMIDEIRSKRPGIEAVIERLREIRQEVSVKMIRLYNHFKEQFDTKHKIDQEGKRVPLTGNDLLVATTGMTKFSLFYEAFVLKAKEEVDKVYSADSPYYKAFYNEHREVLDILANMGDADEMLI